MNTPFTIEAYTRMLRGLLSTGRRVMTFRAASEVTWDRGPEKGLILRHDVDYCPATASKIAQINNKHGVSGTFFILVSSPLYNIFSPDSIQALQTIQNSNQNIGLHYHHTDNKLDSCRIEREMTALRLICPQAHRVVAWHNPHGNLEALNSEAECLGFTSTYSTCFFGQEKYISDSNCRHTADEIITFANTCRSQLLQVLLHPLIWIYGGNGINDILKRAFRAKVESTTITFEENCQWQQEFKQEVMSYYNQFLEKGI